MNEETLNPLLVRVSQSDREAMTELFGCIKEPLLRMFHRLSRCWAVADDLLQGTCLRLWRYRGSFRGDSARAYIYRVAFNEWRDHHSRERRVALAETGYSNGVPEATLEPPGVGIEREEARRRVHAALEALPEPQRESFLLHRFDGLSCGEIAVALGVPRKTVESRLRLALQKLTRRLEREEHRT